MVTIIGGGIAGTLLAGALARAGMPVTAFERRSTVRAGAFLFLEDRAHDALEQLGVPRERLHAVSHPVETLRVQIHPGEVQSRPSNHRMYLRADLMGVLTAFAADSTAEIHYDAPIHTIDLRSRTLSGPGGSHVADGLIIAADGIDSPARAYLEPHRVPKYTGQVVVYGRTEAPVRLTDEPGVLRFDGAADRNAPPAPAFGHFWNDSVSVWFARLTREQLDTEQIGRQSVAPWVSAVHETAPAIADTIETLLAKTSTVHVSNARNVPFLAAAPPHPELILCGDADHAITPAAGVGARDAIEDAAAIYHALRTGSAPAAAMAGRRRDIADERQRSGPNSRAART